MKQIVFLFFKFYYWCKNIFFPHHNGLPCAHPFWSLLMQIIHLRILKMHSHVKAGGTLLLQSFLFWQVWYFCWITSQAITSKNSGICWRQCWKEGGGKNLQMWGNMDEWKGGRDLGLSTKNLTVMQSKLLMKLSWKKGTCCVAAEEAVVCRNNWVRSC